MPFCHPVMLRPAAKYAAEPVERRAAHHVTASVTAMNSRNIRSGVDMASVLLNLAQQFLDDAIEARRGARVQNGHDPRHEELREREQVRKVDGPEHTCAHQRRSPSDQRRQSKIVSAE